MIRHAGYAHISYKKINFIWAASELQRYIPGNIWSFIGRTVRLAEQGMSKKDIAKCTFFEIQFLVFGTAAASALALPFLQTYFSLSGTIITFALLGFLIGIVLFAFHRKIGIKLFFLPDYPPFESIFLIIISTLLFFFFGLGYYFAIVSFISIDPNLIWQITGLSVLSYLIGYLSLLTPSGIGIREGALSFALAKVIPVGAAGFVSLFARFVMTFTEVLYVFISYAWYHTKNRLAHRMETVIGNNKQFVLLLFFIIAYVSYFTSTSVLRYDNFYTGKYDLGNMAQTVWNTTQGRIFMLTNPDTAENASRLAIHADYILVALAPFYALWPDPRNLLIMQSLIVAGGALFVYLIAKEVLKSKNLALVFGFMYLINPSIQRANLYDFHAVVLATTFLLGTYYFLIKKNYWSFLFFAILSGLTKEHIWVIVALFGVILFFQHKKYIFGSVVFIVSLLLSYVLVSHAIPGALGSQHFALTYFSEFGTNPLDIIKNIFLDPQQTINTLLTESRIDYLKQLFYPLGYLSLFAPWLLIFASPELLINLLSNNPNLHQIYYQYTAAITPFLFIAAIYGVLVVTYSIKRLSKLFTLNPHPFIIIYLLVISLYGAYLYGPLPGSKSPNLDMITKPATDKELITQALSQIPSTARVATSNNLGAHLANREHIYVLPLGVEQADYLVFYLTSSQPKESLQKDLELVNQLRNDPKYEIVVEKGIFIVFKVKNTIQN